MGLLVYARPAARPDLERATDLFRMFREQPTPELARSARTGLEAAISPNERLQQLFHPWTSYVIVPLFALANVGGDEERLVGIDPGQRLGLAPPADRDLRARREEALCDAAPDAAAPAGHERDLAGEVEPDHRPMPTATRSRCQAASPSSAPLARARFR